MSSSRLSVALFAGGVGLAVTAVLVPSGYRALARQAADGLPAAAGAGSPAATTAGSPAPASLPVTGGTFGVAAKYSRGAGDTWFNTWADDGNIYATSNDTSGFNGNCNSDLVVNELTGSDPTQLTAPFVNCMTSFGHAGDYNQNPDGCSWKSGGIISVAGTLYEAVARQIGGQCNTPSNSAGGEQPSMNASIVKSTDHGRTWSNGFGSTGDPGGAAPQWDSSLGRVQAMFPGRSFAAPFFINYGQDDTAASTADGGDQYVYAVSNDGYAYDGNDMILGRVLRSQIGDLNGAEWQYYTGPPGGDGSSSASWSSDATAATHLISATHQISQPDIQYDQALHEYILINFYYPYSPSWPGGGTASSSTFSFYEAPHPWGPWTQFLNKPSTLTACYLDCQASNTMPLGLYDPALVPKFTRMNGLSNVIFASGDFTSASRYDDSQLYALHALPFTLSSKQYAVTDDSSPSISYHGSWAPSTFQTVGSGNHDGTVHSSSTPGDTATFTFTGSSIEWIGSTDTGHGYADVSIDGATPTAVDTYSPTPVKQATLFKRTGLIPGEHTITIKVTSQHDPASVLYDFANGSTDGWQPGANVASVSSVNSFADGPGGCHPGTYCLDALSTAVSASAPRTVQVTPATPLNLQTATSIGTYIDGYGGAPGASGYQATLTVTSGTHTLSTTAPVQANAWNPVIMGIGDWPYRNDITGISISFAAVGSNTPWLMHFQVGDVFTGPTPPSTQQDIDAFVTRAQGN